MAVLQTSETDQKIKGLTEQYQPTEKFTLQFNTQTREYDLIPESGMDAHKIRRQP